MNRRATPLPTAADLWQIVSESDAWTYDTPDAEKAWWLRMINALAPLTEEDPIRVYIGHREGLSTDGINTRDIWTRESVDTPIFAY